MTRELTPDAVAMMCEHMNADHADAVAAYARHYAGLTDVASAVLTTFDARGMTIDVTAGAGTSQRIGVPFDHELADAGDARTTLVAMAAAAGAASGH